MSKRSHFTSVWKNYQSRRWALATRWNLHLHLSIFHNDNKFCSILCQIVKIKFVIKNILPIMPCRFSNDLFALKKCCILHIEQFNKQKKNTNKNKNKKKIKKKNKTKKKKFGYQAFNEHSADKLNIACIFEIWNKKIGPVMWFSRYRPKYQNFSLTSKLILFRLL